MLSCVSLSTHGLWLINIHWIFQARVREWVAISFSRGIFPTQGSNLGCVSCIAGEFFTY